EVSGDEAVRTIEGVRHDVLAAHGALLLKVPFVGDGRARDRDFERHDWVDRLREGQLDGTTHLSAVDLCPHHRAEGPDVVEVGTHPGCELFGFRLVLWELLCFGFNTDGLVGFAVLAVQYGALLHIHRVSRRAILCHLYVIAD